MKVLETGIPRLLLIEPVVHGDERGWFSESWQSERYAEAGIPDAFVQDNMAFSRRGILRGLHVQNPYAQGKLVQVLNGAVFDVVVDVRRGSPSFGRWAGFTLSADNHRQLWVPAGFAHGYMVISEQALFSYKCTEFYHPETEFSVRWNDPDIGIEWPKGLKPVLSAKDETADLLKDIPLEKLPLYK